jgi:hypothetical protein
MTRLSTARRLQLFRVRATILLAVFLSAGTSLPSLDALAHHGDGAESRRSQQHIEPAGGCLSHSDRCTLGRSGPGSGAQLSLGDNLRLEPLASTTHQPAPVQRPSSTDRVGLSQPRAPPVRQA